MPSAVDYLFLKKCRLCWQITGAVFLAILAVEAAILIPSYQSFRQDYLETRYREGQAAMNAAFAMMAEPGNEAATAALGSNLVETGVARLRGVAFYDSEGTLIAAAGEAIDPTLLDAKNTPWRHRSEEAIDTRWTLSAASGMTVIGRIDVSDMPRELRNFVLRVVAAVTLIALVVTIVTMVVLRYTILGPIVALKTALEKAAAAPAQADRYQLQIIGNNELTAVLKSFNKLMQDFSGTMAELQKREAALQHLADTLDRRVRERTAELKKAKEAAERSDRAKSEFLANMSHELRTPLNAVVGFSEIIEQELHGPVGHKSYKDYATDIRTSGLHLLTIINDILDITRIETGRMEIKEDFVNVREVVDASIKMTQDSARARRIALINTMHDAPAELWADERALRKILLNLLSNAVKFSRTNAKVRIEAAMDANGSFSIQVIDTGIGIAEEDIERVMEAFEQVESGSSRKHQGVGIGLPLTKRLVELHGGTFELHSHLDEGTTAIVRFPPERVIRERHQLKST